jgi:integrase
MQARTRTLTPLLPGFVAAGEARRDRGGRLLETAQATTEGEQFVVDGVTFARARATNRYDYLKASQLWADVLHTEPNARPGTLQHGRANITKLEEDAFWAWAIVETLRHTGIRIEELLELSQLSLRHYTPPATKTDAERLIPMSPELVTVLLALQRRAKNGAEHVPLSVRTTPTRRPTASRCHTCSPAAAVVSIFAVRTLLNAPADGLLLGHHVSHRCYLHDRSYTVVFTVPLVGPCRGSGAGRAARAGRPGHVGGV